MLIAGVILYIVTSALCASSTSIEALIGFRAMSLSLLKFVGQASLVDDAMLPS